MSVVGLAMPPLLFTQSAPQLASLGAALACLLVSLAPTGAQAADSNPADDAAIRQHRMGTLVVQTTPGANVQVEQTRHEFWFGAALASQAFDGSMSVADTERYRAAFLENFNAAVPENALKWLAMERRRGHVQYATIDAILAWAEQHNVYWGVPQWTIGWMKALDDATLHQTLADRAHDIATRYRGRFAEYDLNNEMIHGNFYADRLGKGITLEMAQWMKQGDPNAVLYVNDYDILTGNRLDDYVAHIRELLAMGVPVGGIGVQGHLHGDTVDFAALRHALDVLAQFKLPIKVTEFNFPGQRSKFYKDKAARGQSLTAEEEAAKARAIAEYYRICFAHPAVDGILMWGFWEGANWIPQSSLYQRDWTPTPALKAYRDLVYGKWWTHWEGKADENGRCQVPAFFGGYRVTSGAKHVDVQLAKKQGTATADLR